MVIRNPFEFSQYSSSFTVPNVTLDSSGIGITGISDLMSFVVTQTKIRQEAIKIGYIDNNPGIPHGVYDFINLDNLLFETPGSIHYASQLIKEAILQMFKGHYSEVYERSAYKPTILQDEPANEGVYDEGKAGGFFHKLIDDSPEDVYYEFIGDIIHQGSSVSNDDISLLESPPIFQNYISIRNYLSAQVGWINSVISILNQLRFIHKKLVFSYPFTQIENGNSNSNCDYSYTLSSATVSATNKPIEIILDMSEVVSSCSDGTDTYGYLCIKWSSLNSPSRMVIMPTKGDGNETDILRKPIWGSTSGPDLSTSLPQIHSGTKGYYDATQYGSRASSDDILKTWDISSESVYDPPVPPIILSGCYLTDEFDPSLPFRNGDQNNVNSDFACIKIDGSYFATNSGDDWDNKLRLVIFPGCSEDDVSGFSWSIDISCLGCLNCANNTSLCGGGPFNGSSSSSSSSQSICSFSQNLSFSGACLKVVDLDLTGAPVNDFDGERYIDLCFNYQTFGLKDRFILLASKGSDDTETSLLRQSPWPGYGLCPSAGINYLSSRPFSTPVHPKLGSSGISPPGSAIVFDSGCIATSNGRFKNVIRISENDVEINDTSSLWYKRVRLFCFGGCDSSQNSSDSQYNFTISCNVDQCGNFSSSSSSSNCIGYGSLVSMYDGSVKLVEDVKVGDELLSAVFTDAESKDNPDLSDLVSGWAISDSSKIKLTKTYVKSIAIGTEPEIYKFSKDLYLTYDHPILIGQPDGSYNFVSSKYITGISEVIGSDGDSSYVNPPEILPNKFITFTIVTEPYNVIFAGGLLVHSANRDFSQSVVGIGKLYTSNYEISHYQKVFGTSVLPFSDEILNPFANSYVNDGMYETLAITGPNGPIEGTSGSGRPTLEENIDIIVSDIDTGGPITGPSSSSSSDIDVFSSSSSSSDSGGGGGGGGSSSSSDGGGGGGGSSSSSNGGSSSSSNSSSSSSSSSGGGGSSSSSSSSSSSFSSSSSSSGGKFTFS